MATCTTTTRSTLVIGNIHCPSCVQTIESILSTYTADTQETTSARTSLEKAVSSLTKPLRNGPSPEQDSIELSTPAFWDVSVSIVNGTVSFSHSVGHSLKALTVELKDAGFEVLEDGLNGMGDGAPAHRQHLHSSKGWRWTGFPDVFLGGNRRARAHKDNCIACQEEEHSEKLGKLEQRATRKGKERTSAEEGLAPGDAQQDLAELTLSIGGMTCNSCTSALESSLCPGSLAGIISVKVLLLDNSCSVAYDPSIIHESRIIDVIEDLGYEASVASRKTIKRLNSGTSPLRTAMSPQASAFEVKLSIEGMTCASCVSSISNALKEMEGVVDFQIDLLGGSGKIDVQDRNMADRVREEIEDMGFECAIVQVTEKHNAPGGGTSKLSAKTGRQQRTVNVRIDGFFCEHCPAKANKVLEELTQRFAFSYTPSTLHDPTSSLQYTADPPDFTLRSIRYAITELGFTLSIIQPETLQDRARKAQRKEQHRILLRLVICVIFCVPTFIFGVVGPSLLSSRNAFRRYLETPIWGSAPRYTVALFTLATPVQFGIGQFFYVRAYKSLRGVWRTRRGRVSKPKVWLDRLFRWGSMDSLVALGTTIAWASSLAYMLLNVTRPGMSAEMGYFDTSVFLLTFILAGRYLESISKQKTGDALLELGKLKPKKGILYSEDKPTEEVDSPFIEVGDQLIVPVGSSPAGDCILTSQSSITSFDEASLTGESKPVAKKAGDIVYAGTINAGPSPAILLVQHGDGETMIDSITSGVREAMSKKASIERIADAITAIFVPVIVGIACFTFVVWVIRGYAGDLPEEWLGQAKGGGWVLFAFQFSVAVLVVACPCGIGLAAPTAQLVGVGLAARHGVMPNGGGEAFQAFSKIDAIVFDKTGTITLGKFQVAEHRSFGNIPRDMVWRTVSVIEQASTHPIALAVKAFADQQIEGKEQAPSKLLDTKEIPGRGMVAILETPNGRIEVAIGNEKLMQDSAAPVSQDLFTQLDAWQQSGKSVVLISQGSLDSLEPTPGRPGTHEVIAALAVTDPLRPEARYVMQMLRNMNIEIYIVSGDGIETVRAVGRQLALAEHEIVGNALPEDKKVFIERLQNSYTSKRSGWLRKRQDRRKLVAMCGDGVNDAIALTQANVSIAQGGGSQAATSTADFALLNESLLSILTLHSISKSTYRRILSNFAWACVYNVVLIPISAGAFYDLGQTKLPAVWASLAMALSSVSVVVNSLLLRWTFRLPKEVRKYHDQV